MQLIEQNKNRSTYKWEKGIHWSVKNVPKLVWWHGAAQTCWGKSQHSPDS